MKKLLSIVLAAIVLINGVLLINAQELAIEGFGVNGIQVGKSDQNDVIKKFGNDYELVTYGTYSNKLKYKKLGLSFIYCQSNKDQTIFSIEIREPFEAATLKGVVLGKSTVEDVLKLYGKPKFAQEEEPRIWLDYDGIDFRNVNLETDDDINPLEDESLINEINIYTFDFGLCEGDASNLQENK